MEQKKINNQIAEPSPLRRIMKQPGLWIFLACAFTAFVIEAYIGNPICCLWIILAAVGYFFASLFKEYADDFRDLCVALVEEKEKMLETLQHKDGEIAELYQEINRLRDELKKQTT